MKKFTKLAAVFAALVLAWACFVACSNSSSDSGSNGADDSSSNSGSNAGSNSSSNSNSGSDSGSNPSSTPISVQALQGLWIENGTTEGWWIQGTTLYPVEKKNEKYIYEEAAALNFSISGNTINYSIENEAREMQAEINGDTLTLKYKEGKTSYTDTYKKINATPTKK